MVLGNGEHVVAFFFFEYFSLVILAEGVDVGTGRERAFTRV
jgi:hypothetical protein